MKTYIKVGDEYIVAYDSEAVANAKEATLKALEEVKSKTSHLKDTVIAVMGCIVNGPGEMADADWGYVGEGNNKVSIYKGKTPLLRHVPQEEAVDKLLELIEKDSVS